MTEEENHIDNREDWIELQIQHQDTTLLTRGKDWSEVIVSSVIGDTKFRVSRLANHAVVYNPESKRMTIIFKESLGKIKVRIALTLLFAFPERISRKDLVLMSDIMPDRIREYLTNPDKGVTEYIDETDSGIVLNMKGHNWALEVLKSIENVQSQKLSIGGSSIEQSTTQPEDTIEEKSK